MIQLQYNYRNLRPHEIFDREDMKKNTIYLTCNPIASVYTSVKELVEFSEITITPCNQIQAIKISYVILHHTSNFNIAIWEWNRQPQTNNTWINFKKNTRTLHQKLRVITDTTSEESGIIHAIMVWNISAGLQYVLFKGPLMKFKKILHAWINRERWIKLSHLSRRQWILNSSWTHKISD